MSAQQYEAPMWEIDMAGLTRYDVTGHIDILLSKEEVVKRVMLYDELVAALKGVVEAADDPDNEHPRDLVDQINWKGIRSLLAKLEGGAK